MTPLKIAITGGTGLIGRALRNHLTNEGHEILVVSRDPTSADISWDPDQAILETNKLEGLDAVIHLAGEPIAKRWTGKTREAIYRSRVESTRLLVDTLGKLKKPPSVLLSASGINFYDSTNLGAALDEGASAGNSFLARVCRHWEEQALRAEKQGIRVCLLRTSVVLSPEGGALAQLLPVFRKGMGGRVGDGKQPFPWVSLNDYISLTIHLLLNNESSGPYNVVSPHVVDNATFVKVLGEVLKKPAVVPMPAFAVKMGFGEMGRALLLEGVDARPAKLLAEGFAFHHPEIKQALTSLLSGKELTPADQNQ